MSEVFKPSRVLRDLSHKMRTVVQMCTNSLMGFVSHMTHTHMHTVQALSILSLIKALVWQMSRLEEGIMKSERQNDDSGPQNTLKTQWSQTLGLHIIDREQHETVLF